MTFYELIKRVYWALDEWIASSLGLGDYYGADEEDEDEEDQDEVDNEDEDEDVEVDEDEEDNVVADEDDGYDDMYKYHDHQA
jgi:hypothetical protein